MDADDLAVLRSCFSGPTAIYNPAELPPGCTLAPDPAGFIDADLDMDSDVDQDDFAILQRSRCTSGQRSWESGGPELRELIWRGRT